MDPRDFLKEFPVKPFEPLAYFDLQQDELCAQTEDCSFSYSKKADGIYLYRKNHTADENYAGFALFGVSPILAPLRDGFTLEEALNAVERFPKINDEQRKLISEIKKRHESLLNLEVKVDPRRFEGKMLELTKTKPFIYPGILSGN